MTRQGFSEWILNHKRIFCLTVGCFTRLQLVWAILYKLKRILQHKIGYAMVFHHLEDPINSSYFSANVIDTVRREEKLRESPTAVVVEENRDNKLCEPCAICLEKFKKGDRVSVLPHCEHVYHRSCINTWLGLYSLQCPMCRDKTLDVPVPATRYSSSVPLN